MTRLLCLLLYLLFACFNMQNGEPMNLVYDPEWDTGHHPFPEMSRFLNSHSRIHRPMKTKAGGKSSSFLQYLCSIADNEDKLEEILTTFGQTYRLLIVNIIEKDCSSMNRQRELGKRTMNSITRSLFPRFLFRRMKNDRPDFLYQLSKNT